MLSTTIVAFIVVLSLVVMLIDFGSTFGFGCQSPSGISCCPPRVGSVVGETLKRRERELLKARNQSQKTFGVVSFILIALQFWRSRTRTVDDDLGELW